MMETPQSKRRVFVFAIAFLNVIAIAAFSQQSPPDAEEVVATFVKQTCVECHNSETSEGGLNLQRLPWTLESWQERQRWVQIHDRIAKAEMPPEAG